MMTEFEEKMLALVTELKGEVAELKAQNLALMRNAVKKDEELEEIHEYLKSTSLRNKIRIACYSAVKKVLTPQDVDAIGNNFRTIINMVGDADVKTEKKLDSILNQVSILNYRH
jgi:hypothetical protein